MKKSVNKRSGFSLVEGLIVILAISIVAVSSWFVYQHNRTKLTNAAAGNQATTTPPVNQNLVKIPELGIQITVPNSIKDLTYKIGATMLNDGRQSTYAKFSTIALTASDKNCGTDFGPLGSLAKITGQYPTSFSDSNPPMEYGTLVKQFPTFFISISPSQAACSANSSTLAIMNAGDYLGSFGTALPTIQLLN